MITRAKADIKLIDDGYLVTVSVGGTADDGKASTDGNLGKVFPDFGAAWEYAQQEVDRLVEAAEEQSGTLPGMDDEPSPRVPEEDVA